MEAQQKDTPWELAFSFSRGLEQPVQEVWQGKEENTTKAQEALIERLRLNSMADQGTYEVSMEEG